MPGVWTRRQAIKASLLAAAMPGCVFRGGSLPPAFPGKLPRQTPWPEANAILAATAVPTFPAAAFPIVKYGGKGDGKTDDTSAFARAIADCNAAGGGRVIVAAGTWLVGSIRLLSNVDLHLEKDATLLFSEDASLFPEVLTRYEGIECVNRSPPIYAYGETNVALTGEGTLDASRTGAWNRGSDRAGRLESLVARGVPAAQRNVTGKLRASFVQPYRCSNVLIQGVTLQGACFWQLHPVLCTNVTIDGVSTRVAGPNTDGCDPESCRRVVINRCTLASGDDNIAVKSGRDEDGRRLNIPCEDIVIMNCQAEGRYGFICLGSEQSGGIRNVYAYNNWIYGRGIGWALWLKSNSRRGGYARNINIDTFRGSGFRKAIIGITASYDGQTGAFPPDFGELHFSNFDVSDAPRLFDLDAGALGPVTVKDSRFGNIADTESPPGISFRDVWINGRPAT
jgi:polygalacturonase